MAEALKTFREALLNEKIFQVGAVKIFATNHYISAVMEADSSSIHLRATPENCFLVNRGPAGSNGRAGVMNLFLGLVIVAVAWFRLYQLNLI